MKKTLVVMAAGMGSRFGGLKQIEPVGPNNEVILDYSVFDAKRCGFDRVVFVIKHEIEKVFKESVGKRLEKFIDVKYAFQNLEDIPSNKQYLVEKREKPWGTVQALLCAKEFVDGSFVVINADDFYGYDSFKKASNFLDLVKNVTVNACITYPYLNVSSVHGPVKRGVCYMDSRDNIIDIVECKIETKEEFAECSSLENDYVFNIGLDHPVSMNMFAFKHKFFDYLEEYFDLFFERSDEELENAEALLPTVVKDKIATKEIILKNIESNGLWMGLTYRNDLEGMKERIMDLINDGEYPNELWK